MLINAVAPFAGAWIEINTAITREITKAVAPFAGAWIEIILADGKTGQDDGRSLRGSVD